jgi:biotin operon repressor
MKLTKENWLEIAQDFGAVGGKELAARFNVSTSYINSVVAILRKEGVHVPMVKNMQRKRFVDFVKASMPARTGTE